MILFIMAALGIQEGVFLDLGSRGWHEQQLCKSRLEFRLARNLHRRNESGHYEGPRILRTPRRHICLPSGVRVCAMIIRENINQLLTEASVPPDIDFVSIDIDGNDYWVWDAISVTTPKVVIIETHIEFGMNNIVVLTTKTTSTPDGTRIITALSPVAMEKLARTKGLPPRGSEQARLQHHLCSGGTCTDATLCFRREHPFTPPQ